jgi:hypothetical protein
LSDEFKDEYFRLLQSHRPPGSCPDLAELCQTLKRYLTKKEKESLQFSFATKLLATLDQELPIYDSLVASVFDFRAPYYEKVFEKRLDKFLKFYDVLSQTSRWLAQQKQLNAVNAAFAKRHQGWEKVPLPKRVDLILWATGKAIKEGEGKRALTT